MSAITDWLDFSTKQTGTRTRGYRSIVTPISGSTGINPGDTVRFDIPVGRGKSSFCDPSQSSITFQVKSTDSAQMTVDGSGYAFLNRMTLLSSGQVLEDVLNYNKAVNTFLDLQCLGVDLGSGGSVLEGCAKADSDNINRFGTTLSAGNNTTQYADFTLPLHLSGVIGTSANKLIPVGILNDLRLEFIIESAQNAVVSGASGAGGTTVPLWTLTNFQLNLQYIDLDPVVSEQIYNANNGIYRLSTDSFRTYEQVVGTASTPLASASIIIPARFSSIKSVLSTFYDNSQRNSSNNYWQTNRFNPFYSSGGGKASVQLSVGSLLFPNTPYQFGMSEMYAGMLQSFHSMGNAVLSTRCTSTNWIQTTKSAQASGTNVDGKLLGTFVCAFNTENLQYKSKTFTSGTNSLTSPIVLNCATFPSDNGIVATGYALAVVSIVHYDAIYEFSEQGVACRF